MLNTLEGEDDATSEKMATILAKMPEPWWSKTWKPRKSLFQDVVDEQGRAVSLREDYQRPTDPDVIATGHPSVADGARSLRDMLKPGVWYMADDSPMEFSHQDSLKKEKEKEIFGDLLSTILVFDPKRRMSAQDISEHP